MTETGDGAIFTHSINRRVTPTEKKKKDNQQGHDINAHKEL